MVIDNRQIEKNASGQTFDVSEAATFDVPRFYADMQQAERL